MKYAKKLVAVTAGLAIGIMSCIILTGCGSEPAYSIDQSKAESIASSEASAAASESAAVKTPEEEFLEGLKPSNAPTSEEIIAEMKSKREAVITMGGTRKGTLLQKSLAAFNYSQDKYWIDYVQYDSSSQLLIEISRNQGPDILYTDGLDHKTLAMKGIFEDLTPYFESSEEVNKEDMIASVWRAGSVGEKMYFVTPYFTPMIYVVEKGYTDNGAWTIEDYFALADKYPEGMLNEDVKDPVMVLYNYVSMAIDSYIDFEEKTCSFDSEGFVQLLMELKEHSEKNYESLDGLNVVEQLHSKKLLAYRFHLFWRPYMTHYKDMRDSVLEFCEIAGMPNEEGELKYSMQCSEMYGISAGSDNKEAAWAFLEYLLSEENQVSVTGYYPARRDVLESRLDAEINPDTSIPHYHTNTFTGEKIKETAVFTEEDKQIILDIVENCYCDGAMNSSRIKNIIVEEAEYYFKGTKTAEEVAAIIQNRMSLYLME